MWFRNGIIITRKEGPRKWKSETLFIECDPKEFSDYSLWRLHNFLLKFLIKPAKLAVPTNFVNRTVNKVVGKLVYTVKLHQRQDLPTWWIQTTSRTKIIFKRKQKKNCKNRLFKSLHTAYCRCLMNKFRKPDSLDILNCLDM